MKITGETHSHTPYDESIINSFEVELTGYLQRQILQMQEAVKSNGDAYDMRAFCYDPTWYESLYEDGEIEDRDTEERVDVPMLQVTDTKFKFTAVPKHCGDESKVSTPQYSIDEYCIDQEIAA